MLMMIADAADDAVRCTMMMYYDDDSWLMMVGDDVW